MTALATAETAQETVALEGSPFKGLEPYSENDAAFFFGRDEWREIIVDNLRAFRLTLLYGGSGVGKSSVLRAAVLHDLNQRARAKLKWAGVPGHAVVIVRAWRGKALPRLIEAIHAVVPNAPQTAGPHSANQPEPNPPDGEPREHEEFAHDELVQALKDAASRVGGRVFVILDQFEEYFLYHPSAESDLAFETSLAEALNRRDLRASFLISIREDEVAQLDRFKASIPGLFDNYLRLGPLDREEARSAIELPLQEYNRRAGTGYTMPKELVEEVLSGVQSGRVMVGQGGAGVIDEETEPTLATIEAPYLQLVLRRLWDEELGSSSQRLSTETFRRLGRAPGIVRAHLDKTMTALSATEQDTAAQLLNYLVTPSGTKIAQRPSDLARWANVSEEQAETTLDNLSSGKQRILRPTGDGRYEIYHDALATPILDWRARWQRKQDRAADRRHIQLIGLVALILFLVAAVVVYLAIKAKHDSDAAKAANARTTNLTLASTAQTLLPTRPDVSLIMALAAYAKGPSSPQVRASMTSALEAAELSGSLRVLHGPENTVTSLAYDPTGPSLAAASADGTLRLWNTGLAKRPTAVLNVGAGALYSVAFSVDGSTLAAGDQTGHVHLWSAATLRPIGPALRVGPGAIIGLAFSPDRQHLATVSLAGDVSIVPLRSDRPSGAPIPAPSTTDVRAVAFSPDSRELATASTEPSNHGSIALLDPSSGHPLGPLAHVRSELYAVTFLNAGELAAGGNHGGLLLWRPAKSTVTTSPDLKAGAINDLALSPGGRMLAGAMANDTVQLWDVAHGLTAGRALTGHTGLATSVAFSRSGGIIAAGSTDRTIRLWNTTATDSLGTPLPTATAIKYVAATAYNPTGNGFVAGGVPGVWRWAFPGPSDIGTEIATGSAKSVALAGNTLAYGNVEGAVWLGTPALGGLQRLIKDPADPIEVVALSTNGSTLAYAGDQGRIYLWDTVRHRRLATLKPDAGKIFSLAFNRSGTLLASGGDDRRIRLWKVSSGQQVRQLTGDSDAIFGVAFSPDGAELASGSADDTVRLWSVATGGQIGQPLIGHHGYVYTVAFSPDGRTLASGSADGTVRLWDVRSRTQIGQPLTGGSARVTGVSFFPNGAHLLAGAGDGTVRIWPVVVLPLSYAALQAEVCGLIGTGLSRAEWLNYAPSSEYSNPCP